MVKLCCWRLAINWNNVQGGQDFTTLAVLWLIHTYRQTDIQTPKWLQIEALSGLSELPPFSPLSRSGLIVWLTIVFIGIVTQGGQGFTTLAVLWLIHTDRHTPKWLQIEALSGLSELPPFSPLSRSGLTFLPMIWAVQSWILNFTNIRWFAL